MRVTRVTLIPDNRTIEVVLNTGAVIQIEGDRQGGSYMQYGGTKEELGFTQPIASHFENWLLGESLTYDDQVL